MQAGNRKSSPTAPMTFHNGGHSTMTSKHYTERLRYLYRAGMRFTDVVIPDLSTNDVSEFGGGSTITTYGTQQIQARNVEMCELIRSMGGQPYIYTNFYGIPGSASSGLAAFNNLMAAHSASHRTLCANGLAKLVDWRANWNNSFDDGIHPTQAGHDRAADLLFAQL